MIKQNSSFPLTIIKSKFYNTYEKYDYNIALKILRIVRVISSFFIKFQHKFPMKSKTMNKKVIEKLKCIQKYCSIGGTSILRYGGSHPKIFSIKTHIHGSKLTPFFQSLVASKSISIIYAV